MTSEKYIAISSEINELESILNGIPQENVIERIGLESRLTTAKAELDGVQVEQLAHKARLTFRGDPVYGSHGIVADFASKSAGWFSDAVAAIAASLTENLCDMGPIPDRQKNQLLITGTTVGSFGFEFEIPKPKSDSLFPEPAKADMALQKIVELFQLIAEGTDDDVAELVEEVHPRAVKIAASFLDHIRHNNAVCALEYKNDFFRFKDVEQLQKAADRIKDDNIQENTQSFSGEIQGVLPASRSFEFQLSDNEQQVLKGKIGSDLEDPDLLNRKYLHKRVTITLHTLQVGQGRPRFTLNNIDDIKLI